MVLVYASLGRLGAPELMIMVAEIFGARLKISICRPPRMRDSPMETERELWIEQCKLLLYTSGSQAERLICLPS